MDPILFTPLIQANPTTQAMSGYMFAPGIFFNSEEENNYLSSLDSDTRDYVMKHTDDYRTRGDIEECISKLHRGK